MLVEVKHYRENYKLVKIKINVTSNADLFIQLFKLSDCIPYNSKSYYKLSNSKLQKEYEQWIKHPSNLTLLVNEL